MNYDTPIEREALRIWQEFEMQFAPRLRRMHPDAMDRVTGAWSRCLREADERLAAKALQPNNSADEVVSH